MTSRSPAPQAPRPDLGDLSAGTTDQLVAHADLDGLRFDEPAGSLLALADATLRSCLVARARFENVDAQRSTLRDVCWERPELVSLRGWRARWRDVIFDGGRIGVLESYTSTWSCVALRGVKASYVNLRGSELVDVTVADSQIDELDLSEATGKRVALPGSRIDRLVVHQSSVSALDLRAAEIGELVWAGTLTGVVLSHDQAVDLAPELARQAGARVEG
ncbi:hypothetical protein KVF89_15970 [Nocardioides carbamazepini]|uniref:pentapeptide repeat-containing protein n=1 Tax=Nocardioides carbamazepini TaxID=2854259 RepID=UPI00214A75B8|nr:hypothetical protein [Nocardioides carbamazepini]MCR1784037.1 hypothetical protein [Nocardioides carbamazepini]